MPPQPPEPRPAPCPRRQARPIGASQAGATGRIPAASFLVLQQTVTGIVIESAIVIEQL
jgi:hypothetical protein